MKVCDLPLCSERAPMVREVAPTLDDVLPPLPRPGFKSDLHLSLELLARVALALQPRPCAGLTTLWPSVA